MSVAFASNLSQLRREKGITQKIAADELGISQALLSHYEKGIRECNLEFVRKAAGYYGVTTDFLLGLTDSKQTNSDVFDFDEITTDHQAKTKTLVRAFMYLLEHTDNDADEIFFTDFFSLAIEKYMALLDDNISLSTLCDTIIPDNTGTSKIEISDTPLCIKTVDDHAKKLIAQNINEILG